VIRDSLAPETYSVKELPAQPGRLVLQEILCKSRPKTREPPENVLRVQSALPLEKLERSGPGLLSKRVHLCEGRIRHAFF